jgi:hypothetical protein
MATKEALRHGSSGVLGGHRAAKGLHHRPAAVPGFGQEELTWPASQASTSSGTSWCTRRPGSGVGA